jgi:hypothetical protein
MLLIFFKKHQFNFNSFFEKNILSQQVLTFKEKKTHHQRNKRQNMIFIQFFNNYSVKNNELKFTINTPVYNFQKKPSFYLSSFTPLFRHGDNLKSSIKLELTLFFNILLSLLLFLGSLRSQLSFHPAIHPLFVFIIYSLLLSP